LKKLFAILCMAVLTSTHAQTINAVVTMPPGSGVDVQARLLMKRYDELYGTTTVFNNRPGADGAVGINHFVETAGTGPSLLFASTGHITGQKPADFGRVVGLVEVARQSFVLAVRRDSPINSWNDYVKLAQSRPGEVTMGNGARGMMEPIMHELEKQNNIKLNLVYYSTTRGELDLVNGSLFSFVAPVSVIVGGPVEDKLKVIAVSGNTPVAGIDVGANKLGNFFLHQGVYVSAGIDPQTKNLLNARFNEILKSAWARERFNQPGVQIVGGNADDYQRVLTGLHTTYTKFQAQNTADKK
jgi:tripartite-type tricarboxylate transporter receptor subunit TctC